MIVFTNCFDVEVPRQILLQINAPDSEGWRQYRMSLVTNNEGDKLVEFEYALGDLCIERLKRGMTDLIDRRIDKFDFEPIEPAFRLKISRSNLDEFEMLCIVDISYVRGGPATETGIGIAIVVKADEVKRALEEIN